MKNLIKWILLTFVFLLPLQGIYNFGSYVTYGIKYSLILVLWAFAIFLFVKQPKELSSPLVGLLSILAFFTIVSQISLLANHSPLSGHIKSLLTALAISIAPLVIVLSLYLDDKHEFLCHCFFALICGIVLTVLISTIYYFFGWQWLIPRTFLNRSARLYGAIKSPNALAVFVAVGIGCVCIGIQRKWFNFRLSAILLFIFFYALICSLSKSVILSAFCVTCIWLWLSRRWNVKWTHGIKLLLILTLFAGLSVAIPSIFWKQEKKVTILEEGSGKIVIPKWKLFNPNNPVLGVLRIKKDFLKTGNRIGVWKAGIKIFAENWTLGIGLSNWKLKLAEKGYIDFDSPHNGLLEIAGGLGILGALFYLFLPIYLIKLSVSIPKEAVYRIALICLIVFYLLRELISVSGIITFSINGMLFWLLVGFFFSSCTEPVSTQ